MLILKQNLQNVRNPKQGIYIDVYESNYLYCDMLFKNGSTKQIIKMLGKSRLLFIMTKDLFFVCLNSVNMFSFALGYVCRRKEVGFVQKATSKVP